MIPGMWRVAALELGGRALSAILGAVGVLYARLHGWDRP